MKQAQRYIDNVLSGAEMVGEYARLAVVRHINDLKRSDWDYYFDEVQAEKAISFFKKLRHTKGSLGGKFYDLQDNQAFFLANLFGWRQKENGLRRFTQAYREVSRKNGKTEDAAGIEVYTGFFENEEGAEVYTAATTRDQANMVFRAAKKMCRYIKADSAVLNKQIEVLANSIVYKPTDSFIQKVSADAGTLDGLNPHCAVIEEYHAHKTDEIKGVMQTAQGARENPLLLIITTAGFNKEAPCFRVERANAVAVLKGERKQENLLVSIYAQDEGEGEVLMGLNPDVPEQARQILKLAKKSNPNLGRAPTEKYILDQVRDARNKGGSTRVQVLTKNFNMWLDAPKVWIPESDIKAVMRPVSLDEFSGRETYFGIDLAATADLTALALFSPADGEKRALLKVLYWLPEATIAKRQEVAPYREWTQDGHVIVTPGNIVDYNAIKSSVYRISETVVLETVNYDVWNAYEMAAELTGNGFAMQPVRPYYSHMSEPTKRLEKMIHSEEIEIDENPALLWNFRNIALDYDSQDNIKPNKAKSGEKIDGVVASIMALFGWLQKMGQPSGGSYLFEEDSELITL